MGRSPCCDEVGVKKGPWTTEEDKQLVDYIEKNGHGSWRHLPKLAGLNRCGKSCRLRWTNYLRPDIKRGKFSEDEERLIIHLHSVLGNKWSAIATRLAGRTDNEIKNHWNTHLRKKLLQMGIDPVTHRRRTDLNLLANLPNLLATNQSNFSSSWDNSALQLHANAAYLARLQLVQGLLQVLNSSSPNMNVMSLLGAASLTNHQFNNLQQTHQQFGGLENGSNYHQDPTRINSSLPRFQDASNNYFQPSAESSLSLDGGISGEHGVDVNGGTSSYHNNQIENSTPLLVSASLGNITTDKMKGVVSIDSPSTSAQPWDGVNLEDLDNDLSWKDILDQISWSSEQ